MKNKLIVVALLSWLGLLNSHLTASAQPVVTTLAATGVTATNAAIHSASGRAKRFSLSNQTHRD